ncbi:MAG TPA: NTP transferase domain-containing protein [Clostridiales bacterium]|nr:NTP transferase domain-containing protein [Clostridiales bacterium]
MKTKNCAVILAAGHGKRMKSDRPKVLCEVLFKPMIDWVIDAAKPAVSDVCVVVGFKGEVVKEHLKGVFATAEQAEQLGTGHAVTQARDFIRKYSGGNVLVLCGDAPLIDTDTIQSALDFHIKNQNAATVISARIEEPKGYGRIVREKGRMVKIVEEKDADEVTREINEVNSGAYWFSCDALLEILPRLSNNNAQKEYYLTDAVQLMRESGLNVEAYTAENQYIVLGANDRAQLHQLNNIARQIVLERLMGEGVEIICSDGVIIGPDVKIGVNTRILPCSIVTGNTYIGSGCVVGPCVKLHNCIVTDNSTVSFGEYANGTY